MVNVLRCTPSAIAFAPHSGSEPVFADRDTERAIRRVAAHLRELHSPIAFPTETVYGLAAAATNPDAVRHIFAVKGRPTDNPLIVHVSSTAMLRRLLPADYRPSPAYESLMDRFWPGPLTLLFPANPLVVPHVVTAGLPNVAVRMPSHPVARALISIADLPLAAPSANTSGKPSPTTADHVRSDLGDRLEMILDGGACHVGLESTVVDGLSDPCCIKVLRPGGVTVENMRECLRDSELAKSIGVKVHRRDFIDAELEMNPSTPGMKYRHYSPSQPVLLLKEPVQSEGQSMRDLIASLAKSGRRPMLRLGLMVTDDSPFAQTRKIKEVHWVIYSLGSRENLVEVGRRLFHGLHALDSQDVDYILAQSFEETHEGLAIMNRLQKAALRVCVVHMRKDNTE